MYITKPVFTTPVAKPTVEESAPALAPADATLENPSTETQAPPTQPMSVKASEGELPLSSPTPFEETNLRVQHILTAIAPDGQKARIDIEVPVLYQSRKLRWSASEVANARELLRRLSDYQERTRVLQGEGRELLGLWNQLVENSIPASQLRADSPTLPANQLDAADSPRSADLDSTELIQIQPANP